MYTIYARGVDIGGSGSGGGHVASISEDGSLLLEVYTWPPYQRMERTLLLILMLMLLLYGCIVHISDWL